MNWIHGKKTYFVAVGMVLYAVLAVSLGKMDFNSGADMIWQALAVAGLRHGVTTTVGGKS